MAAPKLNQDDLVENLVGDPSRIPNTRMMMGWLGKAGTTGRWRLYLSPTMNDYLEFDGADVVNSQRLPLEAAPLGGTALWLQRDAKVVLTRLRASQAHATFLDGPVSRDHIGRFGKGFTIGDGDTTAHTTPLTIITILVTTTIIVIVSAATETNCPNANNSVGLCPTYLSHCC